MSSSTNVHYQGAEFRVTTDNLTGWKDTYTLTFRDGSHEFTGFFNLEQLQEVVNSINGAIHKAQSESDAYKEAAALAEFDAYQESMSD